MEQSLLANSSASGSPKRRRWIRATTLGDLFGQTAQSCAGDALVFPAERISYPELEALSDHYAKALIGMGVERHDKVGILLAGGIDYVALLLAIAKVHAVSVPVNGRFKERELRHVVNRSDMKVLFTAAGPAEYEDYAALLCSAFPTLSNPAPDPAAADAPPKLAHVVCLAGDTPPGLLCRDDFETMAERVSDEDLFLRQEGVRIRDTAVLMFTSGTTSSPKAAMLSHEALCREAIGFVETRLMLTSEDRFWTPLPLYHIGGIAYVFTCFAAGAAFCHPGFFKPEVALRQLEKERCTVAFPAFETIWLAVLGLPAFPSADLSSLRLVFNVGVPERLRSMQEALPHAVQVSAFGSTEASSSLSISRPTDTLEARLTTGGHPMPGMEARIVDPDSGVDLGPGQRGEILFRGPNMFDGYYREPELTKQVIDESGWFHSGDLGEMDEDGRLTFKGRLKDMLKVGGENVAALEVEEFLITHPAVLIAQVVAVPDDRYVEVPAAFVQLRPGAVAKEQDLIDYCLGSLATFKVPRYVRFVDEWPMSGTKIQKFVLREQIADELRRAGITEAPKLRSRVPQT